MIFRGRIFLGRKYKKCEEKTIQLITGISRIKIIEPFLKVHNPFPFLWLLQQQKPEI